MGEDPKVLVRDYMTSPVTAIDEQESIARAQSMMRERHIRHLPVTRKGQLVGVVSERVIFLLLSLSGLSAEDEPVEEAMSDVPFTVSPEMPLGAVAREMALRKYGSAIVVEGGHIVGIVTTVDLLRSLAEGA
ncbi:MAG TPA: CBS domain-containing protein [Myxococcaceae bacterium]|nr:CBS domain-containing protein [Myxococcaceae bacterium]